VGIGILGDIDLVDVDLVDTVDSLAVEQNNQEELGIQEDVNIRVAVSILVVVANSLEVVANSLEVIANSFEVVGNQLQEDKCLVDISNQKQRGITREDNHLLEPYQAEHNQQQGHNQFKDKAKVELERRGKAVIEDMLRDKPRVDTRVQP
jgi:hypothetical protein